MPVLFKACECGRGERGGKKSFGPKSLSLQGQFFSAFIPWDGWMEESSFCCFLFLFFSFRLFTLAIPA